MPVEVGKAAPEFSVEASGGAKVSLKELRGKWVVLYFYPKDDTPGCTKEACGFRDSFKRVEAFGAIVLGVSPDNPASHEKFIRKYELPFMLLSDPGHKVAETYGVWVEKNMYGVRKMGIERSTFLIAPDGSIRRAWRKVKVDGHVEAVLEELTAAQR
jgi:thioredoxin-dependent peroxiredoxin